MIPKIEKKVIDLFDKNYKIICCLVLLGASLLIRYVGRDFVSLDAEIYLMPWRDEIISNGRLSALDKQVGNYNMLYQTIIALLSYLPIKGIYTYKIISVVFDYLLGIAVAGILTAIVGKDKREYAVAGFFVTVFSPIVIMNSSIWAQCDAIYTFFCMCAILMLIREKYGIAFILWGIAFAFKLQAVFILPLFVIVYLIKKKFSVFYFCIIPVVMVVFSLPNILFFHRSIGEVFRIYENQIAESAAITYNYPSAILALTGSDVGGMRYEVLKHSAFVMVFILLVGTFLFLKLKKIVLSSTNLVYVAFLSAYVCVLFLPCMRERYGYVYEILAIVILIVNRKTFLPFVMLILLSCITYGNYLFNMDLPVGSILGSINLVTFMLYSFILWKDMINQKIE